jgi:hypothetical protein
MTNEQEKNIISAWCVRLNASTKVNNRMLGLFADAIKKCERQRIALVFDRMSLHGDEDEQHYFGLVAEQIRSMK